MRTPMKSTTPIWKTSLVLAAGTVMAVSTVQAQESNAATETPFAIIQLYQDDVSKLESHYADLDQDGVADELDHCPNSRLHESVDKKGCALVQPEPVQVQCEDGSTADSLELCPVINQDNDGDGVLNERDKCPNTPKGVSVDEFGCETGRLVLSNIVFDTDSATIRNDQVTLLKENAAALNALTADEILLVTGHTDSVGTDAHNMTLSWARAESTKQFLQQLPALKEVKIYTLGQGETSPIADNANAEGRQRNRRIELQIMSADALPKDAR